MRIVVPSKATPKYSSKLGCRSRPAKRNSFFTALSQMDRCETACTRTDLVANMWSASEQPGGSSTSSTVTGLPRQAPDRRITCSSFGSTPPVRLAKDTNKSRPPESSRWTVTSPGGSSVPSSKISAVISARCSPLRSTSTRALASWTSSHNASSSRLACSRASCSSLDTSWEAFSAAFAARSATAAAFSSAMSVFSVSIILLFALSFCSLCLLIACIWLCSKVERLVYKRSHMDSTAPSE
mmetsp:Transcript_15638/g.44512  ORF Transcript_15638/g.44512 Transcript_15638/m.44512 type:complete len:240 (-) Transcript_15638:918-1637(-)